MSKIRKKRSRGKSKGNSFERAVSKLFDTWWGVPKNTFWRTVLSGGWVEPGDIAPRARVGEGVVWWPFIVECKFYKSFSVLDALEGNKTAHLLKWWKQLTFERENAIRTTARSSENCIRLLICKRNHGSILVGISNEDLNWSDTSSLCFPRVELSYDETSFILCRWEDFSKIYNQHVIRTLVSSLGKK